MPETSPATIVEIIIASKTLTFLIHKIHNKITATRAGFKHSCKSVFIILLLLPAINLSNLKQLLFVTLPGEILGIQKILQFSDQYHTNV